MGAWWEDSGRLRTIVAVCGMKDTDGRVAERFTLSR